MLFVPCVLVFFLFGSTLKNFTESPKLGVREWINIPSANIQQNTELEISVSFKCKISITGWEFSQTWNKQREGRHAVSKESALLSAFLSARIRSSSLMTRLDRSLVIFQ